MTYDLPKNVAATTNTSVDTVLRHAKQGHIRARRVGGNHGAWRIAVDAEGWPIPAELDDD